MSQGPILMAKPNGEIFIQRSGSKPFVNPSSRRQSGQRYRASHANDWDMDEDYQPRTTTTNVKNEPEVVVEDVTTPSEPPVLEESNIDVRASILIARLDQVRQARVDLERDEAVALDEVRDFLKSTGRRELRKDDFDYAAWAEERRQANSQSQRWLQADADLTIWKSREFSRRAEIRSFQDDCVCEMQRLTQALLKATLPACGSEATRKARMAEIGNQLIRFRRKSMESGKALQDLLNEATTERRKAEKRRRLAGDENAAIHIPRLSSCVQCGLKGVERPNECPNWHNHANYDGHAPVRS